MDIKQHWKTIRKIVNQANRSNRFCAVATVNPDGSPRISPIGSLILGEAGESLLFRRVPQEYAGKSRPGPASYAFWRFAVGFGFG